MQGSALSWMLCALSLEPFLHKVCSSVHRMVLLGFQKNVFLSTYADDVVICVNDPHDVNRLVNTVSRFSTLPAARVNWEKKYWQETLQVLPQGLVCFLRLFTTPQVASSVLCRTGVVKCHYLDLLHS